MIRKNSVCAFGAPRLDRVSSFLFVNLRREAEPAKITTTFSDDSFVYSENFETFSPTTSTKLSTTATLSHSGLVQGGSLIPASPNVNSLVPNTLGATERKSETILEKKGLVLNLVTQEAGKSLAARASSKRSWRRFLKKSRAEELSKSNQGRPQAQFIPSADLLPPPAAVTPVPAVNGSTTLSLASSSISESNPLKVAYETAIFNYCSWNPDCDAAAFFEHPQTTALPTTTTSTATFRPPFAKKISHVFLRTSSSEAQEQPQVQQAAFTGESSPGTLGSSSLPAALALNENSGSKVSMVAPRVINPATERRDILTVWKLRLSLPIRGSVAKLQNDLFKIAEFREYLGQQKNRATLEAITQYGRFLPAVYENLCKALGDDHPDVQDVPKPVVDLLDYTDGLKVLFSEPKTKRKQRNHKKTLRKNKNFKRPQKTKIYNTIF